MSMYSDLLAVAMQAATRGEEGRLTSDELLTQLVHCHGRLTAQATPVAPSAALGGVAGDLALQMEYDLTLIQLCTVHGIDYDVARFDQPVLERRRLEHALHAQGVHLPATSGFLG